MKNDYQQPGTSIYSTFVSVETGDKNASMLTTTRQQSNHEANKHRDSARADWCESH